MTGAPVYRPRSDVIVTDLGTELVLLDPGDVEMYSLDAAGRAIWLSLPATARAAAQAVTAAFAVEAGRAALDTGVLLNQLLEAGLVEVQQAQAGDGGHDD